MANTVEESGGETNKMVKRVKGEKKGYTSKTTAEPVRIPPNSPTTICTSDLRDPLAPSTDLSWPNQRLVEPEKDELDTEVRSIAEYKTRQIKLPGVESRRDYEKSKASAGKSRLPWFFSNRLILSSTIVYYNIYDDDSVKEVAYQLSFPCFADSGYCEVQAPLIAYRDSRIKGTPTIFYAVYSRNPGKVKKWLKEGADPNSVADLKDLFDSKEDGYKPIPVKIPLLAFAILLEEPEIVRLLLTFGANPLVIPGILRLPVIKPAIYRLSKSPEGITKEFVEKISQDEATKWCTDAVAFNRLKLATNLSIRYDLQKADTFKITARQRQLAQDPQSKMDYTPLFKLHFDIIGQDLAVKKIIQELLRQKVQRKGSSSSCGSTRPTVFIFAGPIKANKDGFTCRDLSKTIWVVTTNILNPMITEFYEEHRPLTPEKMTGKESRALMSAMKKFVRSGTTSLSVFADYVDSIIPFFPFDEDEQLALAHRALWKLRSRLLRPTSLANGHRRNLLGNIKLVTEKDYQHCRTIAKSYIPNEGAGSMKQAVADIEREVFYHFLESSEDAISEKDEKEVTEYILKVEKENDAILVQTGNVMPKEDF
ncbi:hypothetical protein TWF970_001041 [Orbilia oligospora]|uniref:Uncharacterized protein n=1 Tax=Orbilia oligospora TaxID=2813651 RepID=A0A7C8VJ09_ORBOL|nr:hypothetical protein TWF970_001041 [Orbilia oligospora]